MKRWHLICPLIIVFLLLTGISPVVASSVQITDSAGRTVTIPSNVQRVAVLTSPVMEIVQALGVEDRVMAISGTIAGDELMFPQVWEKPVVASSSVREPDYEKLIELAPELVITYGNHPSIDINEVAAALKPAGIEVLGIDGYKLDTLLTDIKTLGKVFQKETEADQMVEFFEDIETLVQSRVDGIKDSERVVVYGENHVRDFRGMANKSEWHSLFTMAGAVNILEATDQLYVDVDPELILVKNPAIILKEAPRRHPAMGFGVTEKAAIEEFVNTMKSRVGWSGLQAVQNNQVYLVSRDLGTGPAKIITLVFFAKEFYPSLFSDLDPHEYLRYYYEDLLGVPLSGIFIYPEVIND